MDLNQYLNPETLAILQTGGYFLMLGLMIVEWPLVTFAAAFLASLGFFDIWIVFFLGWMGDILGDLLFYSIGRYGFHIFTKKTTIDTPEEFSLIGKLDQIIHENLALAILIIKFTPYAPPIGLTYIGKIKVDIKKYLFASVVLCVPIPLVTTLIGFHLGRVNDVFQKYSGTTLFLYLSWAVGVIIFSLWLVFFLRKKSEKVLSTTASEKSEKTSKSDEEASKSEK